MGGQDGEAAYRGPPPARAWGRGKLRALTPLLVPKVGAPGRFTDRGGKAGGNELLQVRVPVGAPFIPLAHPSLRRRDGLNPSVASPAEGPPPPLNVSGVGPIPTVGGLRRGGWGKTSSWAFYPRGVWVRSTPRLGVQVRSACPPDSRTYPAPPVAGIASFLHITLGWLRGDHRTLQASLLWFRRGGHLSFLLFQLSGSSWGMYDEAEMSRQDDILMAYMSRWCMWL